MKSTWVKGALLLLIMLGAGIAIGAAYQKHNPYRPHVMVVHMEPAEVLGRLNTELNLDRAQHDSIAAVLRRRQVSIDSVWASVQPQVRAVVLATLLEMMAPLNEQQRARYRILVNRVHPGILDGVQPPP